MRQPPTTMRHLLHLLLLSALLSLVAAEPTTIAEWDFTTPGALSGAIPLDLRGASKLEGGLVVLEEDPSKPSGAITKRIIPSLTPANAFSIEATIVLDADFRRPRGFRAMLFDNKYITLPAPSQAKFHGGVQFWLQPADPFCYAPAAAFGFGASSKQVQGVTRAMKPGVPHTVKLHFTAAGRVFFTVDGEDCGGGEVPAGPLAPAANGTALGNRCGSQYHALGGKLLKVVLRNEPYQPISLVPQPGRRRVFLYGETGCAAAVELCNFGQAPMPPCTIHAALDGRPLPVQSLPDGLAPSARRTFDIPVDGCLLPGDYKLQCRAVAADGRELARTTLPVTIAPPKGDFLPVILWGATDDSIVAAHGFTHQLVGLYPVRGEYQPSSTPEHIARLDDLLRAGLYGYPDFYAHYRFVAQGRFLRKGRDGKPYARQGLEASHPEVVQEFTRVAADVADALGDHPAWDFAQLNSEVRGTSQPAFGGPEEAAFRKFSGRGIPPAIAGSTLPPYEKTPGFPWNRIVDHDRPELFYLRWWWKTGDGWNDLDTALSATLHQHLRRPLTTFHDPAVRVPPLWGSGGKSDLISQWIYAHPDPIKLNTALDELRAMADGCPGQKLGIMTQAIWYRSNTAPIGVKVANPPEWLAREPRAEYITIAPDCLREALWCELSHQVDAVMYHGATSLLHSHPTHGYRYTNPHSKEVLKEMCERVVRPLGPVVKRVPERAPRVGILQSFTSTLYASRHFSWGWGIGWVSELHLALQWAGLEPAVFYEEHLLDGKLPDTVQVLFLPGAEVLTDKVLARLQELQRRGVILVGDEFTTPALMVDLRIQSIRRENSRPRETKAALQRLGQSIARALAPHLPAALAASNPDLVVRRRGTDQADYVFVVNDKRTFGDYVGQWKMVMEKGLPNNGSVTVRHPAGAAYDLVGHQPVRLTPVQGGVRFQVRLAPADGTVVLLLPRPIAGLQLLLDGPLHRGRPFTVKARILDDACNAVPAILPAELTIADADGRILPGSGFYAAENGELAVTIPVPSNLPPGTITCTFRDLASGKAATTTVEVR